MCSIFQGLTRFIQVTNGLKFLAAITLIMIILGTFLAWPAGDTGHYVVYARTTGKELHQVVQMVVPNSPAALAGLRVGDRIVQIDGSPVGDVVRRSERMLFESSLTHPKSVTVLRSGQMVPIELIPAAPTPAMQREKVAFALLALLCWFTGYYLGVVRRQQRRGTSFVAIFWMFIGFVLGVWAFAQDYLIPTLVLAWLLSLNLLPLLGYIHSQYPPRLSSTGAIARNDRKFLLAQGLINSIGIVGSLIRDVPVVQLIDELLILFAVLLPLALLSSIGLLIHAHRHATRAHTQRQIRLILSACFGVLFARILIRAVPPLNAILPGLDGAWLDLMFAIIPLAYLIGDGWHDLYRIDRIASRLLMHLAIITGLTVCLNWIVLSVNQYNVTGSLFASIAFVVLYRPVQSVIQRLLPGVRADSARELAMETTLSGLARSLDPATLADTLVEGVKNALGTTALAYYRWDVDDPNILRLHTNFLADDVPQVLAPGIVITLLRESDVLIEPQQLINQFVEHARSIEESALLLNPHIVLWGSIRHQGEQLGVLLVGERDNFDNYHAVEVRTLRRLIAAASLAFANSSLHMQQQQAESLVRQLYRRLQIAQDEAARDLARELHDEVINGQVGLNIETLERVLAGVEDPQLRGELERIIEGENTVIGTLRQIGEQLYPTGIDDPLGLTAVVRGAVLQYQGRIGGGCRLEVTGTIQPVPSEIQYEVLRVTREALTNVVKHAKANAVTVELAYENIPQRQVRIRIQDKGENVQKVVPKAGHLGVRTMQESARSVGGVLSFRPTPGGGTTIEFTVPLEQKMNTHSEVPRARHVPDPERAWRGDLPGPSLEPLTQR